MARQRKDEAEVETVVEPAEPVEGETKPAAVLKSADVGYKDKPVDQEDSKTPEGGANTVMVQAVASFAGEEGDKGPTSEPFPVSRQRYADLKANGLVELVK